MSMALTWSQSPRLSGLQRWFCSSPHSPSADRRLSAAGLRRTPSRSRRRRRSDSSGSASSSARRTDRFGSGKFLGRVKPSETAMVETLARRSGYRRAQYMALRVLAGLAAFVAVLILTGNILIALPGDFARRASAAYWLRHQGQKRVKAFEAQLAELIDLLVGALRAGHGFLQGLESVSNQIEDPTRSELTKVMEEVNVGISPVDSLQAMGGRVPSYDLSLLISAIALQRQPVATWPSAREPRAYGPGAPRVRGEVHALTTGPRASSYVLGASRRCCSCTSFRSALTTAR